MLSALERRWGAAGGRINVLSIGPPRPRNQHSVGRLHSSQPALETLVSTHPRLLLHPVRPHQRPASYHEDKKNAGTHDVGVHLVFQGAAGKSSPVQARKLTNDAAFREFLDLG